MSGLILIVPFVLFVVLSQSVKIVNENQRGVLFRLGRLEKIVAPGLVVILPTLDRLLKIDLNEKVPGWQGLSTAELEIKIKEVALTQLR